SPAAESGVLLRRQQSQSDSNQEGGGHQSPSDVGHFDLREGARLGRAELGIAVGPAAPDAADQLGKLLVAGPEPQRRAEIVAFQREEAGVEATLGREAGAGAAAAERLGDGGDDADL